MSHDEAATHRMTVDFMLLFNSINHIPESNLTGRVHTVLSSTTLELESR